MKGLHINENFVSFFLNEKKPDSAESEAIFSSFRVLWQIYYIKHFK